MFRTLSLNVELIEQFSAYFNNTINKTGNGLRGSSVLNGCFKSTLCATALRSMYGKLVSSYNSKESRTFVKRRNSIASQSRLITALSHFTDAKFWQIRKCCLEDH